MAPRTAEVADGLLPSHRLQRFLQRGRERASSTSSPSKPRPRSLHASRPTTPPPKTPPGFTKPGLHSSGSSALITSGLDLYDPKTGGCHDSIQENRVNLNQGAESTLAFLMSLGEMKLLESTLATYRQVQVT